MALRLAAFAGCLLSAAAITGLGAELLGRAPSPDAEYFWPHARGHPGRYSVSDYEAPEDLQKGLEWSWHHPDGRYHTTVVGAPLLDGGHNIYLATEQGVRKFGPSGQERWFYESPSAIPTCPSLMGGALFGSTVGGEVFALDMETGEERWVKKLAESAGGTNAYVEAYAGTVVAGLGATPAGGNTALLGLDAGDGGVLWQYDPGEVLWNVMPVFPGDSSSIVMDVRGGVHKVSLRTGRLVWRTPPPENARDSFGDGGVIVGPDGTSYTCSNIQMGEEGTRGALRAYRAADGGLLWSTELDQPCNSWPVVSRDGLSVIVPAGAFVDYPAAMNTTLMSATGTNPTTMQRMSAWLGDKERETFGMKDITGSIRAFSARTGAPHWRRDIPGYGRVAARGDGEGLAVRQGLGIRDICLPAQFTAPTIGGDGTIYVGRADGKLYAFMGPEGNGSLASFDAGAGFLHPGAAFAPGLMAIASCDGLFVFGSGGRRRGGRAE